MFDRIRRDFPMLSRIMNGKPLVYLDNAATTQKPTCVLERMERFYRYEYATVRRGVYGLSQEATSACEEARERCRRFLGAAFANEIIFTKGTTEALNLVAASYGRKFLRSSDEVIISTIEHHANIVPWQQLCEEKGAELRVIPVDDRGELLLDEYAKLLSDRTKIVAIGHVSNALGTINPVQEIAKLAHARGAIVVVDGAQAAPHLKPQVEELGADFYCFSSHKVFGPTGLGVLYGRRALLEAMDPYQTGGDMIASVSFERTTFAPPPAKFEAGTPPIAQIIGLSRALEYIEAIGYDRIAQHEQALLAYATEALASLDGVTIIGRAKQKAPVISFVMKEAHPHDIGTILDQEGIAVRAGHHCAMPTMKRFGVPATARASFALYNTREEVDQLVQGLHKVKEVFHL